MSGVGKISSNVLEFIIFCVVVVVFMIVVLLTLSQINSLIKDSNTKTILLAVGEIVISVMALIVALTIMTLLFASRNLTVIDQPLALPEGSIRAVIALMLIVIFAVAAIFLYRNIAETYSATAELQAVSSDQLKQIPVTDMLSEKLNADNTTYTVVVMIRKSAASEDFAKQLLTVISTLVVSISSFFLGHELVKPLMQLKKVLRPF